MDGFVFGKGGTSLKVVTLVVVKVTFCGKEEDGARPEPRVGR